MLDRDKTIALLTRWNDAWNEHDLDRVMELLHDEVEFENWTGGRVKGKDALRQLEVAEDRHQRVVRVVAHVGDHDRDVLPAAAVVHAVFAARHRGGAGARRALGRGLRLVHRKV